MGRRCHKCCHGTWIVGCVDRSGWVCCHYATKARCFLPLGTLEHLWGWALLILLPLQVITLNGFWVDLRRRPVKNKQCQPYVVAGRVWILRVRSSVPKREKMAKCWSTHLSGYMWAVRKVNAGAAALEEIWFKTMVEGGSVIIHKCCGSAELKVSFSQLSPFP